MEEKKRQQNEQMNKMYTGLSPKYFKLASMLEELASRMLVNTVREITYSLLEYNFIAFTKIKSLQEFK